MINIDAKKQQITKLRNVFRAKPKKAAGFQLGPDTGGDQQYFQTCRQNNSTKPRRPRNWRRRSSNKNISHLNIQFPTKRTLIQVILSKWAFASLCSLLRMSIAATHWLPRVTQWSYTFVRSNWVFRSTPSPQAGPVWPHLEELLDATWQLLVIHFLQESSRFVINKVVELRCLEWVEGLFAWLFIIDDLWLFFESRILDVCLSRVSSREDVSGSVEPQNISVPCFWIKEFFDYIPYCTWFGYFFPDITSTFIYYCQLFLPEIGLHTLVQLLSSSIIY